MRLENDGHLLRPSILTEFMQPGRDARFQCVPGFPVRLFLSISKDADVRRPERRSQIDKPLAVAQLFRALLGVFLAHACRAAHARDLQPMPSNSPSWSLRSSPPQTPRVKANPYFLPTRAAPPRQTHVAGQSRGSFPSPKSGRPMSKTRSAAASPLFRLPVPLTPKILPKLPGNPFGSTSCRCSRSADSSPPPRSKLVNIPWFNPIFSTKSRTQAHFRTSDRC